MSLLRGTVLTIVAALVLTATPQSAATESTPKQFDIDEATIESIHEAMSSGDLTCADLVRSYLQRIEAHDKPRGGELATNAVQSVNREAMKKAAELDAAFEESGPTGPLHCIPVLVKDQVETTDMPTTYGSKIFKGFRSKRDATIVTRMREAGAVMLAKTNMGEFASGWAGSAFGVCRNPYDLTRAPSSSSCGTGVGIASNYGAVGIAEDTGGSTRGPAAWNNAVGLRPTTPLISRFGTMPAKPTFDTLGPLTRTVEDAAMMTNVIAGYDPKDPLTAYAKGNVSDDYAGDLDTDDLEGKRIGILRQPMDPDTDPSTKDYARVRKVADRAYADLESLGAEVVDPVRLPRLLPRLTAYEKGDAETEEAVDGYLSDLVQPPAATFRDIATSPKVTPTRREPLRNALGRTTRDRDYLESQQDRRSLRRDVMNVMAKHDLDAVVYATFDHEPPVIPDDQLTNPDSVKNLKQGNNRELSPVTGLPALAVPAGFTSKDLPVGIDILGRPFTEELLFEMAYAYEQGTDHREAPPRP